jgi:hypothetical protein
MFAKALAVRKKNAAFSTPALINRNNQVSEFEQGLFILLVS